MESQVEISEKKNFEHDQDVLGAFNMMLVPKT